MMGIQEIQVCVLTLMSLLHLPPSLTHLHLCFTALFANTLPKEGPVQYFLVFSTLQLSVSLYVLCQVG